MRFEEALRKNSFWIVDRLMGGAIHSHYSEINEILGNDGKEKNNQILTSYLDNILNHAIKTTPFYANQNAYTSLLDFPVINKNIINSQYNSFISSKLKEGACSEVITSGSTGTPFRILQDSNKKKRNTADTIYFAKLAGFTLGEQLVYLKVWNRHNKKSKLRAWMENIWPVNVMNLSDQNIKLFFDHLSRSNANKGLLGYASAIETISKYLMQNSKYQKADFKINSIITISEGLNESAKAVIKDQFGAKIVSRYSNMENGIIAQQCLENNEEFHINVASYHVEVLKMDRDVPASEGELGRIVVTDYFNYAMPMIRYDTGDLGSFLNGSKCTFNTPVLNRIEGRKMDIVFNTKGELISSFTITNSMWNYPELKQYQFIQKGTNEYTFRLNVDRPFSREKELIKEFTTYFGEDAKFTVEYVEEIPLLNSGKRKKVVNQMTV